jgi:hypothetical protein
MKKDFFVVLCMVSVEESEKLIKIIITYIMQHA